MAKKPAYLKAHVQISAHGVVYLYNGDGVWIGPGLGEFRTVRDAKAWGRSNGYTVAHQVRNSN